MFIVLKQDKLLTYTVYTSKPSAHAIVMFDCDVNGYYIIGNTYDRVTAENGYRNTIIYEIVEMKLGE